MFIYENGNSLNLTYKGQLPVENPEIVIKGYEDGATLTVNGTVYGSGLVEFEKKANLLVYQRDNKLAITFHGVAGMSNPEVTLDEVAEGVIEVVVAGTVVKLTFDESGVVAENVAQTTYDVEDLKAEEPVVDETDPQVIPEDDEEEPTEVVEE